MVIRLRKLVDEWDKYERNELYSLQNNSLRNEKDIKLHDKLQVQLLKKINSFGE